MAYSPTTWEDGVTALSAENLNNIEEGVQEAMAKSEGNNDMWSYIRNLVYPVGSIYMSATLSTPEAVEAVLGGTWEAWGSGKVPVGVNTSDTSFNTAEKTGGTKDAVVVSHGHPIAYDMAMAGAHDHSTPRSLSSTYSDFVHAPHALSARQAKLDLDESASYMYLRMNVSGASQRDLGRSGVSGSVTIPTDGGHTHSWSGNATEVGTSGTNKNLQPYITCYMYKRTA